MSQPTINYVPPGPVAEEFHKDNSFVRGLMGPVGSGKSSACCMELFSRALEQAPQSDGIRRTRWAVIRNTYPELKSTTIKTWQDWFGDFCTIKWDTPITGMVKLGNIGDGTGLEMEVVFLACDLHDDIRKLKSLELTGGWINEAGEVEKGVFDMLTSRVDRFPAKKDGGATWTGVVMDTNPPDDDSWWYDLEASKPQGYRFFRQPGGLYKDKDEKSPTYGQWLPNPDAENVQNLNGGHNYYIRQMAGKTEDWIKVFLGGEYGTTLDGKPVYPEWSEKIHLSTKPLMPYRGMPIVLSFDFGLTPACTFLQISPKGQLLTLRELVSENMGIRQFYGDVVLPFRNQEFAGYRIEACGDPAGTIRAQTDEKTCMDELKEMGLFCEPAATNEFIKRRESVAFFLQRNAGGEPGFLLDPSCKVLRKGFNSGYRYERLKTSGPARFKDRPVKDRFSHVHDALQYGCMQLRREMNPVYARQVVNAPQMAGWV